MKDILISIVIVTFNEQKNIEECIKSVINHSGSSYELIIKDGGSTDDTIKIITQFQQNNQNIILKIGSDHGIYDALNQGMATAEGKWIYFLGADDRLLPGFTAMLTRLEDLTTIYYGNFFPNNNGQQVPEWIRLGSYKKSMLAVKCINHQSVIYPTEAVKTLQFDLRYPVHADYDMNIKLWGNKSLKREFHNIALSEFNMGGFSSYTADKLFKTEKVKLIRKSFGELITLRYLLYRQKRRKTGEPEYY